MYAYMYVVCMDACTIMYTNMLCGYVCSCPNLEFLKNMSSPKILSYSNTHNPPFTNMS